MVNIGLCLFLASCAWLPTKVRKKGSLPDPDLIKTILSSDTITLYSLLPVKHCDILGGYSAKEKQHLLKLPRFHDYPIYGQVRIATLSGRQAWSKLLADSFEDRPQTFCEFEPRHAVRFWSEGAFVDVLMCFECGDMLVYQDGDSPSSHRPVWSQSVHDQMNKLLDDNRIRRDLPDDAETRLSNFLRSP